MNVTNNLHPREAWKLGATCSCVRKPSESQLTVVLDGAGFEITVMLAKLIKKTALLLDTDTADIMDIIQETIDKDIGPEDA